MQSPAVLNKAFPLASAVAFTPSDVFGPVEAPMYTTASHSYLDSNAPTFMNSYDNYATGIYGSRRESRVFCDAEYNAVGQMRGRTSGDPPSVYENTTDSNVNLAIVHTLEKVVSLSELPAPPYVTFDDTSAEFPKFMGNFEDRVKAVLRQLQSVIARVVYSERGKQ